MLASDNTIGALLREGRMAIDPLDPDQIQPASIDLTMDSYLDVLIEDDPSAILDPAAPVAHLFRREEIPAAQTRLLLPGQFALASTREKVSLDATLAAKLEGCSSLGRLGLIVHATAGFIDPGFRGHITLELNNVASLPIALRPGMKIAQLAVFRLTMPAARPYGSNGLGSHYQNQPRGPQASQSWRNFRLRPAVPRS